MFGNFGFSYIGLIFLIMLFIPNLFWTKNKPENYTPQRENKILRIFESAGQALVTVCALIFTNFNPAPFSLWSLWLIFAFLLLMLYEICWIRYFRGKHTLQAFYKSFLGIPLPLAVLPVAAFLCLGIYGKVPLLILSDLVLGIGHIGIHAQHLKEIHL